MRHMIILAIETSCDDTCVAIIEADRRRGKRGSTQIKILSNIVSSQVKIHQKYGGVYPFLAKREHQKNLPLLFEKAKKEAKNPKIDLIAVTVGPGLEPCLWVGVNFANDLAKKLNLPIIPINHIEAHIFASLFQEDLKLQVFNKIFPATVLVVSGGHTQLILVREFGKYKILGETRDDAAGECFDKIARMLGLGYPGGPAIETKASKIKKPKNKIPIKMPRPMIYQKNYDFSFSGLKTAALYNFKKQEPKVRKSILRQSSGLTLSETEASKAYIQALSAETQQAIIDVLIHKTIKAAKDYKVKSIILGGGVTANKELRKQFKEKIKKDLPDIKYYIPDIKYSTDNALMIAVTAYFHWVFGKKIDWKKVTVNANLRV